MTWNLRDEVVGTMTIFILAAACIPLLATAIGCVCWLLGRLERRREADVPLPRVTHRPHCYVRGVPFLLYRQYMPQPPEPA